MEVIRARRKPGTPTNFVYFDPAKQDELGPQLGLERKEIHFPDSVYGPDKTRVEWWYNEDRSHFPIPVGHMVPLDENGRACGFVGGPSRFADEYELVEE